MSGNGEHSSTQTRNQTAQTTCTKQTSAQVEMVAVCLNIIAKDLDRNVAQDLLHALLDEKFDIVEFRENVRSLEACQKTTTRIVDRCRVASAGP